MTHVAGLALGLASVLLMGLYVDHELSYDRFHDHADRTHRVLIKKTPWDGGPAQWRGLTRSGLAPMARASMAGVRNAACINDQTGVTVVRQKTAFEDTDVLFADRHFFEVFSFEMLQGDAATALQRPYTAVVTKSLAARLFGDQRPIGQTIRLPQTAESTEYEITGVVTDPPSNTHLRFDLLVSFATQEENLAMDNDQFTTYIERAPGVSPATISEQVLTFYREKANHADVTDVRLEPVEDVYFSDVYAARQGDIRLVSAFGILAIVVLLLACTNYVNLAVARTTRRVREIGVRKALGAGRSHVAGQFVAESIVVTLASIPLAMGAVYGGLPAFNTLAGANISASTLISLPFLGTVGIVAMGTGIVAGSYPAFKASRYRPIEALRDRTADTTQGAPLRKSLIVFQFVLATTVVLCTFVIVEQFRLIESKDLGFDPESVVTVPLDDASMRRQAYALKSEIERIPGVETVAIGSGAPGDATKGLFGRIGRGFSWRGGQVTMQRGWIDDDFLETFDIPLLAGRNLRPSDSSPEGLESRKRGRDDSSPIPVLLNESAVQRLGLGSPGEAVGEVIEPLNRRVVGVVPDFHYRSMHHQVESLALERASQSWQQAFLIAEISGTERSRVLDAMKTTWEQAGAMMPMTFSFLEPLIDHQYRDERRTLTVFAGFSGLTVFLACLGLFGLAAHAVERRTKEIGIRKVLGATAEQVAALVMRDFAVLVGLACVLAVPVAYTGMDWWLSDFAYRISPSPGLLMAGIVAIATGALLTVGVQAVRASHIDPAVTLRGE